MTNHLISSFLSSFTRHPLSLFLSPPFVSLSSSQFIPSLLLSSFLQFQNTIIHRLICSSCSSLSLSIPHCSSLILTPLLHLFSPTFSFNNSFVTLFSRLSSIHLLLLLYFYPSSLLPSSSFSFMFFSCQIFSASHLSLLLLRPFYRLTSYIIRSSFFHSYISLFF